MLEVAASPRRELCGMAVVVVAQWRAWRVAGLREPATTWIEAPTSERVVFGADGSAKLLDGEGRQRWTVRALDRLVA